MKTPDTLRSLKFLEEGFDEIAHSSWYKEWLPSTLVHERLSCLPIEQK